MFALKNKKQQNVFIDNFKPQAFERIVSTPGGLQVSAVAGLKLETPPTNFAAASVRRKICVRALQIQDSLHRSRYAQFELSIFAERILAPQRINGVRQEVRVQIRATAIEMVRFIAY